MLTSVQAADRVVLAIEASCLPEAERALAIQLWSGMPETGRTPQDFRQLVNKLREHSGHAAAKIVIDTILADAPRRLGAHLLLIDLLFDMGDYAAVLEAHQRMLANLPDAGPRYKPLLTSLISLGRLEEAAAQLASAPEGERGTDWFIKAELRLVEAVSDEEKILDYCSRLRVVAPGSWRGYTPAIAVHLRQKDTETAETLAREAIAACPRSIEAWVAAARSAEAARQPALAEARWAATRKRFPREVAGYAGGVRLAEIRGQATKADKLIAAGANFIATDPILLHAAIRSAIRAGNPDRGVELWGHVVELDGHDPAVIMEKILGLVGSRRGRKPRLDFALNRFDDLHETHPGFAPAYSAHLRLMREAQLFEAAAARGSDWARLFPMDAKLAMTRAQVAQDLGDHESAINCLLEIKELGPRDPAIEAACIRALRLGGQTEQAERAVRASLTREAGNGKLLAEYIALAVWRGDWRDATARAEEAVALNPRHVQLRNLLRTARNNLAFAESPSTAPVEAVATARATEAILDFSRFESLGGQSGGCEFGLVQRHFGVAPLSLLVWASITPEGLLHGLQTGFEHIDSEAHTNLIVRRVSADRREYAVESKTFGLWSHTFVNIDDMPAERMLRQSLRRLKFLTTRLLEDLKNGEKIFVYKVGGRVQPNQFDAIFEAFRAAGGHTLLCAVLADDTHPAGEITMPQPGLFIARMSRFSDLITAADYGLEIEQWRDACIRAASWTDFGIP